MGNKLKRLIISIFRGQVLPPAPKEIVHRIELIPHRTSEAARLVAVDTTDTYERRSTGRNTIADANLVKITASGYLYLYHTVNPALGYKTNSEGRLNLLN